MKQTLKNLTPKSMTRQDLGVLSLSHGSRELWETAVAAAASDPLSTVPDPASQGKKSTDPVTSELTKPLDDKKPPK